MNDKFIVTPKDKKRKPDEKSTITSIRIDRELLDAYGDIAAKCDRSRNELMCMALQFALDKIEIQPAGGDKSDK